MCINGYTKYVSPLSCISHADPSQGVARGMCTDLAVWDSGPRLPEELAQGGQVELQKLSDLPGKPFEGFEDMFFDEGGRAGGWRKRRLDLEG